MRELVRHKKFKKAYKKLPVNVQQAIKDRLLLFASEPFNIALHNHALRGKYEGCRSINVTGDFRIIYSEEPNGDVLLLHIGTHSQLYK
jgi:addiction module RelE/StbE family toxin